MGKSGPKLKTPSEVIEFLIAEYEEDFRLEGLEARTAKPAIKGDAEYFESLAEFFR